MTAPPAFLHDLAIVLAAAALTTIVCQRLRLPVIVGYLLAGLLVGPGTRLGLVADDSAIRTLAELGVVLLMFSIGLEFSLRRLGKLLPVVGPAAAVEVGLMLVLGFAAGRLLGWAPRDSLFLGGVVAISSTMIVAKAFEDRRPSRRLEDLVLGVLVMEDLVAILLIVFYTAEAVGTGVGAGALAGSVGRLLGFLVLMLAGGMLLVPRTMRLVTRLGKDETILVTTVGLAFLFALLAHTAGYSVALGGFLAGALVRESGRAHRVAELMTPVRDMFVAIFFVAVGMLVDPGAVLAAWPAVLAVVAVVVVGKFLGVTLGGFLTGFGMRTSVQAGMTLAQVGEFSFVIAGIGLAAGTVAPVLYPVIVAVSLVTALLTPVLMRAADPVSAWIDRRLPHRVQTVVTLYESWIELVRRGPRGGGRPELRWPVRWMILDALLLAAVFIGTTLLRGWLVSRLEALGASPRVAVLALMALSLAVALPFGVGLVTSARRVAIRLAERALPKRHGVDQAHAPRGVLTVVMLIALVLVIGVPLLALTAPFLSAWPVAMVLGGLLLLLAVSFWRSARNLENHAQAGAELIVDVLARQGRDKDEHHVEMLQEMLPGLGSIVPFTVETGSAAVGQSLSDLNLRGMTGVTVVALVRGPHRLVFPKAEEVLQEGDVLALTGSHEAIATAHRMLLGIEHPIAALAG